MQKVLLFLVSSLSFLILFSCSKEKQLEKTLYKSGNWNIQTSEWNQISQSTTTGQSVVSGTTVGPGTFWFNDDGSGSYNFSLGNMTYAESFTWSVSEETFTIIKNSQNIDFFTGNLTQIVISFSGSQVDENTIEIDGSDTRQYTSGDVTQTVMTGSFTLTR